MTYRQELIELAKSVKAESAKMVETEESFPGSPVETEMKETWRVNKPAMYKVMVEQGALDALAHVVVERMIKRVDQLETEGWNPSDAKTEAYRELMMLDD